MSVHEINGGTVSFDKPLILGRGCLVENCDLVQTTGPKAFIYSGAELLIENHFRDATIVAPVIVVLGNDIIRGFHDG
jgi:hypothetical protein